MHKFIASVYVTIGQTKGKTLLPMPPSDASTADTTGGRGRVDDGSDPRTLESAIVTWTRQIKNVLRTDPEQALMRDDGEHPGPLTELEFWEDKAANLNAIHEQLSGAKIHQGGQGARAREELVLPRVPEALQGSGSRQGGGKRQPAVFEAAG